MKILSPLLIIAALVGGGYALWVWSIGDGDAPRFRTAEVARGDLQSSISATGTIEPEEVIDVGAQVVGKIRNLGQDPKDSSKTIDYNSEVEEGTILAQIDDAIFKTQVAQAKANLQRAEADLLQMRARLFQRERDWQRAQTLTTKNAISEQDYDLAKAEFESAKAMLAVGEASIAQSQAALEQAEINLSYTTIRSPVKGIIIDRRVNVGQTVVANLNAPSMFLIAKDLRRLQVWAAVNEADVGQIYEGQEVTFTVDTLPYEVFQGRVTQPRLNATMTQNVVTYTVVVSTDNTGGQLRPYLTANLNFDTGRRTNVLMVPNVSLRYQPDPQFIDPKYRGDEQLTSSPRRNSNKDDHRGLVWVLDGDYLRPVAVRLGLTDGDSTEIVEGELHEGEQVVVGEIHRDVADEATNPFAPKMFNRKRSS